MKKSPNSQKRRLLRPINKHEAGRKAEDIFRELAITTATLHKWRQRYGGMEASEVKKMKELQEENARLKRMMQTSVWYTKL